MARLSGMVDNMRNIPIVGTKSSLLWDETSDAWVYLSGEPVQADDPRTYYKIIPTLYRAVDLRASSIAGLPWVLKKGKKEVDSSADYRNYAGLVGNMTNMLYLIESSLVLSGRAYWKREKNPAGFDKLRHLDPTSLRLDEKKANAGEIEWKRSNDPGTIYTPKEIIYFWYPDPYVEIGPPGAYPVKSSLAACGVLANVDEFAKQFFGRGAVKAMLFSMAGAPKTEAEKFESWWNKYVSGIRNAFRTKVINAEKVAPVVVGEGMQELAKVTFTQEKREEIALALGIPMSILFANSANYATAERDKLNWYEDKVVPEAEFVASVLNEQVFKPLGLHFDFMPETLDIFQEDEAQRAGAMSAFMDAMDKAGDWSMAQALFEIYGVEVSDDAMKLIEEHFAGKEERAAVMQENLASNPVQEDEPEDEPEVEDEAEPEQEPPAKKVDNAQLQAELSRWQAKCLSAVKRGEPAGSVSFVPVAIPVEQHALIAAGLAEAQDAEVVKNTFANSMAYEYHLQQPDAMLLIAAELKRANDLLEAASAE